MLKSFGHDLRVAVIGASGGIGRAFAETLARQDSVAQVLALSRTPASFAYSKVATGRIDLEDEASVAAAAAQAAADGALDLVLVATGVLHGQDGFRPEKSWQALDPDQLLWSFRSNAIGPAIVAKHFLPLLRSEGKAAFAVLSARVGSIGDNVLGGWYAYRSSKAALNMLVRTLAIELARKRKAALCVALHPGTVDTALSKPFQQGVPAGKLFTPTYAAERLLDVVDALTPADSGGLFAWDGQRIPY